MRFIASVNLEATYPMVSDDEEEDVVIYFMISGQIFSITWRLGTSEVETDSLNLNGIFKIYSIYILDICIRISNIS